MSEITDHVTKSLCEELHKIGYGVGTINAGQLASALAQAAIKAMRVLPEDPGPRYTAGEYSRRNIAAMIDDALS